jgi:hypothetical protein
MSRESPLAQPAPCCSALIAPRRFSGVARNLRALRALLGIHISIRFSTYTYVRTKHLRQVSTGVAIRWREGVKANHEGSKNTRSSR